jgi:hypothetical protein
MRITSCLSMRLQLYWVFYLYHTMRLPFQSFLLLLIMPLVLLNASCICRLLATWRMHMFSLPCVEL